jgi:hypothetical protein
LHFKGPPVLRYRSSAYSYRVEESEIGH